MHNTGRKERVPQRDLALQVVPLIDIMFLLLLFFMLGADMTQRELEEVVLPKADQVAQESKIKVEGEGNRTTVNVFHRHSTGGVTDCPAFSSGQVCRDLSHWMIAIRSNYFTLDTIVKALDDEAKLEVEEVKPDGTTLSRRHKRNSRRRQEAGHLECGGRAQRRRRKMAC